MGWWLLIRLFKTGEPRPWLAFGMVAGVGLRGCTGEVMIVVDDNRERLEELFASAERAATATCRDCMPYENNLPIWVARGLRVPMDRLWREIKLFI